MNKNKHFAKRRHTKLHRKPKIVSCTEQDNLTNVKVNCTDFSKYNHTKFKPPENLSHQDDLTNVNILKQII